MPDNIRKYAARDVLLIIGVAAVVQAAVYPISWKFASIPAALAVIMLSTFLIRAQGWTWADFGLKSPSSLGGSAIIVGQALLTLVLVIAVSLVFALALEGVVTEPEGALDRFAGIEGNFGYFLLWLTLGWIIGGFVEEMVFRGFLINRVESLLTAQAPSPVRSAATILAVIMPALLFGLAHYYYQGLQGAIMLTAVGITFGACYILFGRRLWPVILAHGLLDTVAMVGFYVGIE